MYGGFRNSVGRRAKLDRKYIASVEPLAQYILQVNYRSGSRLLLDMKPHLHRIRFRPLTDPDVWNSAVTNGIFVRFGNVELSHDEMLSMAEWSEESAHDGTFVPEPEGE